jgi:hypothetical protein
MTELLVALLMLNSQGLAQTGYIYLHKNATDENSSPDFSFNVTGPNSFNKTYSLNDQHPTLYMRDVGATGNGGLYAVAGGSIPSGSTGYGIFYKPADATTWTQTGGTAIRIDGGPGNTNIHVDNLGETFYYNGTTVTPLGSTDAVDVAFDKSGTNRVFYVNSTGQAYYRDATSGSWTQLSGITSRRIDVAPNGLLISTGNISNPNVFVSNFNGSGVVNLGSPAGTVVADVAVGDDGIIYAVAALSAGPTVYRYTGGYAAGGSWVQEPTSRLSDNITGGGGGQLWSSAGSNNSTSPNSIWSRTASGFWIDDEVIRTTNTNAVLIPVPAGTYSVVEAAPSGWSLGAIDVYDPTSNSSTNVSTATTSVNVAAGEVVHLVYRNFLIQSFPVVNTCSGSAYLETFGTGTTSTLGGALTGQTSYHHISASNQFMQDGYYLVASNTDQADPRPGSTVYGSYNDHTTGNGTGRMMIVNASYDKGEFFRRRFTGLLPGTSYSFSAWVLNLNNLPLKPNVLFEINDPATKSTLSSVSTGNITTTGVWQQYQLQFTATQSDVDLVLRNNNIGGNGNDLALDDISFGLARPNQPVVTITDASCTTPGSLTVNSPTGPTLEYSLDGNTYQTSPIFANVAPASYSLTARYTNSVGCISTPVSVTINAATAPVLGSISGTKTPCSAPTSSTYAYTNSTAGGVWSVSPTSVATINASTGVLTTVANASGTATITYTVTTGSSCTSTATYTITVSPTNCTPMPVGLVNFTAQAQIDRTVLLSWKTSWEASNKLFIVERSKDLISFERVGQVSDVAGTSNSINTYRFVDAKPYQGTSYYRLSQTDLDGTTKVFPAVSVVLRTETYGIFPNPVRDGQFTLNLDEPLTAQVNLYAADGRPVQLNKVGHTDSSVQLKTTQLLTPGVYVLTVTERGQTRQHRIVIN